MERQPITFADLEHASGCCLSVLTTTAGNGWSADLVSGMDWTSRQVVDHLCNTLAFYTNHVVTSAQQHQPRIRSLGEAELSDAELARTVPAWVRLLGAALRDAEPGAAAWHPLGMTDEEGFLALACNELVIHASDVARAHGAEPEVDEDFCRRLLDRLFPLAAPPADEEAWQVLLWANGRPSVTGRLPQKSWRSHPRPLDASS